MSTTVRTQALQELKVKDLFKLWLKTKEGRIKPSSFSRYKTLYKNHIHLQLGDMLVTELTEARLEEYIKEKSECGRIDGSGGLSPKTVSDIFVLLKSALRFARKEFGLQNSDYLDVKTPQQPRKTIDTFGDCEAALLTETVLALPTLTGLAYLICLNTGIRLGEMCALRWSDIDFSDGTLCVNHTVQRINNAGKTELTIQTPKSIYSTRIVPIPMKLLELLKCFAASPNSFILTGNNVPMEPRTLQYRFRRFLQKYGFHQHNFHTLRHTFATRCIANGADPKSVCEILGHSNVRITLQLYVHPSMAQKRAHIEAASTF